MAKEIYVLIDPRDETVVYVGQTTMHLQLRLHAHIYQNAKTGRKGKWIHELKQLKLKPLIKSLQVVSDDKANISEELWIRHYIHRGFTVLNDKSRGDMDYSSDQKKLSKIWWNCG